MKYIASTNTHAEKGAEFKVAEYLMYPVTVLTTKHNSNTMDAILQSFIIVFFIAAPFKPHLVYSQSTSLLLVYHR